MNILAISGSPRPNGNTEAMVETFAKSAEENGHTVTIKKMSMLLVEPCKECSYCIDHSGTCIQNDDMTQIMEALNKADMILFASPIFWFGISAQLKAVIDRMYPISKESFHPHAAALFLNSQSPNMYDSAIAQYKGITNYLGLEDKGIIAISGMECNGAMLHSDQLYKVCEFGSNLK